MAAGALSVCLSLSLSLSRPGCSRVLQIQFPPLLSVSWFVEVIRPAGLHRIVFDAARLPPRRLVMLVSGGEED